MPVTRLEPNSKSMMKTKLTLFIAILAVALFGMGCGEFKKGFKKGYERQKKAAEAVQCQFCGGKFPAKDVTMHELRCPKNTTDLKPKPQPPKTDSE